MSMHETGQLQRQQQQRRQQQVQMLGEAAKGSGKRKSRTRKRTFARSRCVCVGVIGGVQPSRHSCQAADCASQWLGSTSMSLHTAGCMLQKGLSFIYACRSTDTARIGRLRGVMWSSGHQQYLQWRATSQCYTFVMQLTVLACCCCCLVQKQRKDEEFGVTRGIDFKGVRSIVNYDVPDSVQVGRSANDWLAHHHHHHHLQGCCTNAAGAALLLRHHGDVLLLSGVCSRRRCCKPSSCKQSVAHLSPSVG